MGSIVMFFSIGAFTSRAKHKNTQNMQQLFINKP